MKVYIRHINLGTGEGDLIGEFSPFEIKDLIKELEGIGVYTGEDDTSDLAYQYVHYGNEFFAEITYGY